MTRKYTQRGYQQDGEREEPAKRPRSNEGPKSPNMTAFRETMRCGMCGARVELALEGVDFSSSCTNCKADLRTCKNCVNFDPGARFECRAPLTARVANKTKRTDCISYSPRRTSRTG